MSDYLTIKWGSSCSYDDIFYNDGYSDFIFLLAKKSDTIEPIYEVIKKEASEKQGRTLSPNKISRKTYKVTFRATESLCDTLNTIPLANIVVVQFPDGAVATIKGDDVTVNITDSLYDKNADINHFLVELLFLTNVTIKKECCVPLDTIPEDSTAPIITSNAVITNTVILEGTASDNYFLNGYYREFWQATTGATTVVKMSMYSKLGGWFIDGAKGVYKTTNGFVSATAKLTSNVVLNNIKCLDENNIIAVGNGAIYISTDSGVNWVEKVLAVNFTNLKIYDANRLAFCGDGGKVYLSADFGTTLTLQTTGTIEDLYGIDIKKDGVFATYTCIVVGNNGTIVKKSGFINFATDNTFTTSTSGAMDYSGFVFSGVNGYACAMEGTVKKTIDNAANWTIITTGVYTAFSDICLTKYGILVVGKEDINIGVADAITQILDDNVTSRVGCASYQLLTDHSEYACLGSKVVVNGNNTFINGGYGTADQLVNNSMVVTFPTTAITYVVYIEAFLPQFTGGSSAEILVKT